jgi:hypothetical protein
VSAPRPRSPPALDRRCAECALRLWTERPLCCPATGALHRLAHGHLTGRAALACFSAERSRLVPAVAAFLGRPDVGEAGPALVAATSSTVGAIAILTHELELHRRAHPAVKRALAPLAHPAAAAFRAHLLGRLGGAPTALRAMPRRPPTPSALTWRALTRALAVKTRIPAWVTAALPDAAAVYRLNGHPAHTKGPRPALLSAAGVPPYAPPLGRWLRGLDPAARAALFVLVRAEHQKRAIRVSWAPTSAPTTPAVVCTACMSLLSAHRGAPHNAAGPVIDPRAGVVACGACGAAPVAVVPLTNRRLTLGGGPKPVVIGGCEGCGATHTLAGPTCARCAAVAPEVCICRRPSKAPTTPFVCLVRGQLTRKWACERHAPLLPPSIEDLDAIATKLNIRLS